MIKNDRKRRYTAIRKGMCLLLVGLMVLESGCGQEQEAYIENVELLEPVGVAVSYETAARRNLYDVQVFSGLVCPYVEEYELEDAGVFAAYDAYPGDTVRRGSTLLHANTENIDKQIENQEKSIADMEESYREFLEENEKSLQEYKNDQKYYTTVMGNLERQKPEQYEEGTLQETDEYREWYSGRWGFLWCDGELRKTNQAVMELEEAIKERKELYELDHAYSLLQLKRLKEDKGNGTLKSGMAGNVAGIFFFSEGDWMMGDYPLMAVCDTSKVDIRCDYISRTIIQRSEDVYAIVNGKRYEVEYEVIEAEEYRKLEEQNGVVYTTFHVISDAGELEMGAFAVIVVKNRTRENVITVPKDAVNKDGNIRYVYRVTDSGNEYTTVSVGMTDGLYTEILSGVQEGDKILTDQAVTAGEGTVTVQRGRMGSTFSEAGYLYYPSTEAVANPVEYGTCYFVKSLVNLYQHVQKGEVLAQIRVVPDEAEIGRNEQKLIRERERLEDLKKKGVEGNEKLIKQMEKSIQDLEELINHMKSDAKLTEIKAPRSGIITVAPTWWSGPEEDSLLGRGEVLYVVADESVSYVFVEDPNSQLTYGNVAQIGYSDREGNQYQITGDVVTLNKRTLSARLVADGALIKIDPKDIGGIAGSVENMNGLWTRSSFRVTVQTRTMDNVLVVPRSAVTESGGRTYVKVRLESGEIQYRSFIAGGYDATNYWVVEGLTEGMELCLK